MVSYGSIAGALIGVSAIALGFSLEGGQLAALLHPSAFLIIIGGTLGALLIQFPSRLLLESFVAGWRVFFGSKVKAEEAIDELVNLAQSARERGLFQIESQIRQIDDPWAQKIMELVVDTQETARVEEELRFEQGQIDAERYTPADVFEAAGGYTPTLGVLGAVLGLVQVMQNISDPEKLGAGISIAFISTVYGVGIANIFCFPLAGKLRMREHGRELHQRLVLAGTLGLARGDHPRVLQKRLERLYSNQVQSNKEY